MSNLEIILVVLNIGWMIVAAINSRIAAKRLEYVSTLSEALKKEQEKHTDTLIQYFDYVKQSQKIIHPLPEEKQATDYLESVIVNRINHSDVDFL